MFRFPARDGSRLPPDPRPLYIYTLSLVRLLPRYLVRFLARFDGGCLPARERFVHLVHLVHLYARTSSDLQFETQSPKTKVQRLVLFDQRITSTLSVTRLEMQSALLPWVCSVNCCNYMAWLRLCTWCENQRL